MGFIWKLYCCKDFSSPLFLLLLPFLLCPSSSLASGLGVRIPKPQFYSLALYCDTEFFWCVLEIALVE